MLTKVYLGANPLLYICGEIAPQRRKKDIGLYGKSGWELPLLEFTVDSRPPVRCCWPFGSTHA